MANKKLYDLTDDEINHLQKLGFKPQGIGYAKPNGYMATKQEIFSALKKPVTSGSAITSKYIYTKILQKAIDQNIIPDKTRASRDWFRNKASNLRGSRIDTDRLFENSILMDKPLPGKMFMFSYDAKHKDKLPYWDAFPLIFMVETAQGGFYGINLHYLPPMLRAKLMDGLYETLNNDRYDFTTKLNINYKFLKNSANFPLVKPCFKHYLFSQVKSKLIYVEPQEWPIATFLPLQKWQGATAQQVYNQSSKNI
jgi:hypothetical protein